MIERLEIIQKRYNELVEELGKPEVLADYTKTMELSKEKGRLEPTVNKYNELNQKFKGIDLSLEQFETFLKMEYAYKINEDELRKRINSL